MDNLITFSITVFTGFFAITNPISNMTVFLSLTQGADEKTKQDINKRANIIAFIIVCVFVLLGKYIFELFNISIPAFKITGGILIFYIGYFTFKLSNLIVKLVGYNVISVIGKIMGLIIAIIGTGMIIEGIKISFDLITK